MVSIIDLYRQWADRLYWKAVGIVYPDLLNSQYAYADQLRNVIAGVDRWLDMGCGHAFVAPFIAYKEKYQFDLKQTMVVGADLDIDSMKKHEALNGKICADITTQLPFENNTFDLITLNMVMEHVCDPNNLLCEIKRVLKPNGQVIVHTPNKLGYTTILARLLPNFMLDWFASFLLNRKSEDIYPTYYLANSDKALREISNNVGLKVKRIQHVNSSGHFVMLPPVMFIEVVFLRLLARFNKLKHLRPCLIAIMSKD